MEQAAADSIQESPFNYSSSKSNIRSFSRPHSSSMMSTAASPFASMFTADLTRFLSGTAFAEVRLAARDTDLHTTLHNQLLCHASRLTRVSEILRLQLGPMLKTLPARPMGYGGPEAQPLVVLDAPLSVLRAFHRLMYEASVAMPAAVLPGLLRLAVLYDMPELELWVLQQADVAGDELVIPTGRCSGHLEVIAPALSGATSPVSAQRSSSTSSPYLSPWDRYTGPHTPGQPWDSRAAAGSSSSAKSSPSVAAGGNTGPVVVTPQPSPEPEQRSCGRDRFQQAKTLYELSMSSLDLQQREQKLEQGQQQLLSSSTAAAAQAPAVAIARSSSTREEPAGAAVGLRSASSLNEQKEFWRKQQQLLEQEHSKVWQKLLSASNSAGSTHSTTSTGTAASLGYVLPKWLPPPAEPCAAAHACDTSSAETVLAEARAVAAERKKLWKQLSTSSSAPTPTPASISRKNSRDGPAAQASDAPAATAAAAQAALSDTFVSSGPPPGHDRQTSCMWGAVSSVEALASAVLSRGSKQQGSIPDCKPAASDAAMGGTAAAASKPQQPKAPAAAADKTERAQPATSSRPAYQYMDAASELAQMAATVLQKSPGVAVAVGSSSSGRWTSTGRGMNSSSGENIARSSRCGTQRHQPSSLAAAAAADLAPQPMDKLSEVEAMAAAILKRASSSSSLTAANINSSSSSLSARHSASGSVLKPASMRGLGLGSNSAQGSSNRDSLTLAGAAAAGGVSIGSVGLHSSSGIWLCPAEELADMAYAVLTRSRSSGRISSTPATVPVAPAAAATSSRGALSVQHQQSAATALDSNSSNNAAGDEIVMTVVRSSSVAETAQRLLANARGGVLGAVGVIGATAVQAGSCNRVIADNSSKVGKQAVAGLDAAEAPAAPETTARMRVSSSSSSFASITDDSEGVDPALTAAAAAVTVAKTDQTAEPPTRLEPQSQLAVGADGLGMPAVSPVAACKLDSHLNDPMKGPVSPSVTSSPLSCRSDGSDSSSAGSSHNSNQQSDGSSCPTTSFEYYPHALQQQQQQPSTGTAGTAAIETARRAEEQCQREAAAAAAEAVRLAEEQHKREAEPARLTEEQGLREAAAAAAEAARLTKEQGQREAATAAAANASLEERKAAMAAAAAEAARLAQQFAPTPKQQHEQPLDAAEAVRLAEQQRHARLQQQKEAAARAAEQQRQQLAVRSRSPVAALQVPGALVDSSGSPSPVSSIVSHSIYQDRAQAPAQQQRVRVSSPVYASSKPPARVVKPFVQQQVAVTEPLQYSRLVKKSPAGSSNAGSSNAGSSHADSSHADSSNAGSSRAASDNGSENGSHSSRNSVCNEACVEPTSAAAAGSCSGRGASAPADSSSCSGELSSEAVEHSSGSSRGLLGRLKRLGSRKQDRSLAKSSTDSNGSASSCHSFVAPAALSAPAAAATSSPWGSSVLRPASVTQLQQQRALAAAEVAAAAAATPAPVAAASPRKPPLAPARSQEAAGSIKPASKETAEMRLARELQEKHDAEQFRRAELERLKQAQQERAVQDAAIAERLRQQQQQQQPAPAAAAALPAAKAQKEKKKKRLWF